MYNVNRCINTNYITNSIIYNFVYFLLFSRSLSLVRLIATPWIAGGQASLSITNSQRLLRLTSIELVMPSNRLILCCPLLLLPLSIGVSASTSIPPVNTQGWCPLGWTGWISLQSKGFSGVFTNSTIRILWCSVFFMVQLSHSYMTAKIYSL